jgi:hypothetical protein
MATLKKQPIRAEISIGKNYIIRTPNVMSFNVTRARGQASAQFSASVKVGYDDIRSSSALINSNIIIKAGEATSFGSLPTVFTGLIYKCVINPIRTDASMVMLNISGQDVLSILNGQKINRRLVTRRDGSIPAQRWGIVNSIAKQHTPTRQKFPDKVYSKDPVVVVDWQGTYNVATPDAYRLDTNPIRKRAWEVKGGLVAERVAKTDEEIEEEK